MAKVAASSPSRALLPVPQFRPTRHTKRRFTPEQDELIKSKVEQMGPKIKWSAIAELIPEKTAKQVRERYQHFLAPELTRPPWTETEDLQLIEDYRSIGPDWARIAANFPGRTNHDVKNRFNGHLKGRELDLFLAWTRRVI